MVLRQYALLKNLVQRLGNCISNRCMKEKPNRGGCLIVNPGLHVALCSSDELGLDFYM